jgi:uncharacterized membrane protein YqjE
MSRDFGNQSEYEPNSSSTTSGQEPGLLETARLLGRELREAAHDHLFLAALETRQAGESLVGIIAMGLFTACLLLTAWLALVGAAIMILVQHSLLTAGSALLLVFAVHCLFAMLLISAIRKRSRSLLFPDTITQFEPAPIAEPDTERSP